MDRTRAGVGGSSCAVDVEGICLISSTPRTMIGDVVPGGSTGVREGKGVIVMLRSERFDSRFGLIRAGRVTAIVGSCCGGATSTLLGELSGDHITASGTGVSCGSRRSAGASGCTSV